MITSFWFRIQIGNNFSKIFRYVENFIRTLFCFVQQYANHNFSNFITSVHGFEFSISWIFLVNIFLTVLSSLWNFTNVIFLRFYFTHSMVNKNFIGFTSASLLVFFSQSYAIIPPSLTIYRIIVWGGCVATLRFSSIAFFLHFLHGIFSSIFLHWIFLHQTCFHCLA